jgi:hypothetical protein
MIVIAATRIELRPASWALIFALDILPNAHLHSALSAQNRRTIPFATRPNLDGMTRQSIVAILAGIIRPAALHSDSDDIHCLVVMSAAGLRVYVDSVHCGAGMHHNYRLTTRLETKINARMNLSVDCSNFENLNRNRVRKLDRYAMGPIGVREDAEFFAGKDGAHAVLSRGNQRQPHRGSRFL